MEFGPSASGTTLEKSPLEATSTAVPFTETTASGTVRPRISTVGVLTTLWSLGERTSRKSAVGVAEGLGGRVAVGLGFATVDGVGAAVGGGEGLIVGDGRRAAGETGVATGDGVTVGSGTPQRLPEPGPASVCS